MDEHFGFVAIQQRNGTITIPAQVRRALGLDQPGAQVEVVVRDGQVVLVPHVAIPAEDMWFWSEGHQTAEREVDEHIAAGRYTEFENAEEFLAHLDKIAGPSDS